MRGRNTPRQRGDTATHLSKDRKRLTAFKSLRATGDGTVFRHGDSGSGFHRGAEAFPPGMAGGSFETT